VPMIPPLTDVDVIAETLLTELPDRFFLVGFSFGGYVALAMHALAPERLEGVALVNSSALADDDRTREQRRISIARAAAGEHETLTMEQPPLIFHPDHLGDAELQREFNAMISEYGADRFIAHMEACIARPDRRDSLAGTSTPFLLATARGDRLIPPRIQRSVLDAVEHAAYREFDGAGHMLPMEKPQMLANVLLGWIAQVESMPDVG
jgi:pimeloyl-ACP methyl ester carboxylesterase